MILLRRCAEREVRGKREGRGEGGSGRNRVERGRGKELEEGV